MDTLFANFLTSYHSSYHRSIKMTPSQATLPMNSHTVFTNLYKTHILARPCSKFKFDVGTNVRVSLLRPAFAKVSDPRWSEEIFFVAEQLKMALPVYRLKDWKGTLLTGLWYEPELQAVSKNDNSYRVEKVLASKVVNRKKVFLVQWKGYARDAATWVQQKDLYKV